MGMQLINEEVPTSRLLGYGYCQGYSTISLSKKDSFDDSSGGNENGNPSSVTSRFQATAFAFLAGFA
jgi:hypothetical protein